MSTAAISEEGSAAPAPGQLVTVRNRMWVASDVIQGAIAAGNPGTLTGRPPHVVTLVSIEDDARDEQLRVVWELERGAVAHDQHTLPRPGRRVRRSRPARRVPRRGALGRDRLGGQDRAAGPVPVWYPDRRLPARPRRPGTVHAAHQSADRRRRRPRARPSKPGWSCRS